MSTQMFMILLILPLLLSFTIHAYDQGDVRSWCAKTPHPKPCEYYLSHNPNNSSIKEKAEFLKISLQLALDRAIDATENTKSLGFKCRNDKEKAAWTDCLELYKYTTIRLNRTFDPKCTTDDVQTWLSTALTNLDTCRSGFMELGVSDYILPLMSNNVSDLISNTLSINGAPYNPPSTNNGLPTWVKSGDRKLLQSSSPASQANLVVSQDGSGDYETIQEAVTAASNRSGTSRYIIYIKAGTYEENIQVPSSMENIMFVGDGIGKTIVTGSKSVDGGSTTFNSATVGT